MQCPLCQHPDSRVLDTDNNRRRRECLHCKHRWTTLELPIEQARVAGRARELAEELLAVLPARG